jgi:predicted MFS family arabinose efflux permease
MPPPSALVALRHCNFRLLWAGQLVSFSGTMMQTSAILWHVALLVPDEGKGLALGMVGLVRILPIIAQDILGVGARGWLYAAPAIGAIAASAVMVRAVERIEHRGCVLVWAVAGYGLATVVLGVSRSFWLTCLCLAATGATDTVGMVLRNIIRQTLTPDHLRGRMVSVNMIFFMGGPQLGELEAGLVANWWGAPLSVITGGLGCLAATALRRHARDT